MSISNMIAIACLNPNFSGAPSPAQIAAGPGAVFYDIAASTRAFYVITPDNTGFTAFGGGGSGAFANLSGSPYDNVALGTELHGKLGGPGGYDAINGVPTLTSGVAPAANAPQNYTVTSAGVTATVSALQADIPSLRNGDVVVWSPTLMKWVRYGGEPISINVSGPLTLLDAHNDCTLFMSGTPAITINAGLKLGFGVNIVGTYTVVLGGGVTMPDTRISGGAIAAAGASWINMSPTQDTFVWSGGKL